jgi:hypothetical protein
LILHPSFLRFVDLQFLISYFGCCLHFLKLGLETSEAINVCISLVFIVLPLGSQVLLEVGDLLGKLTVLVGELLLVPPHQDLEAFEEKFLADGFDDNFFELVGDAAGLALVGRLECVDAVIKVLQGG